MENSNLLLMSYDTKSDGEISCLLQEMTRDREVVWEWDSIDHIDKSEAYPDLIAIPGDYMHCNSVFETTDNGFVVSFRHTDQVIKLDRDTGQVIWKMGGKESDFTFLDDPLNGFSAQHHAQILDNGNLLLYDNGNHHEPKQSRVTEYVLDEINKTAQLVWSYQIDGKFTPATGSVQRMPNGNTFIGWGWGGGVDTDLTKVSEVTAEGEPVLEMKIHSPNEFSYRAYKY